MKLENPKHTLTPNEINKFVYCPYQWYYERLYGRKQLSAFAAERNRRLGRTDSRQSNFNKGNEFHASVRFESGILRKAAAVMLLADGIILLLRVNGIV